ncbi:hypothetical protein H6P81_016326 [Aristolochia fimbriata]|uniref:Poly [ADP-ribose] polymerase n=1 Tax=Aristolochia fimbriata TaxID=158543 RepID=A0AAV7EAW6_ARIFI|nr:hypothetical protein H6P81_016326 [Aristolochia fimbriata]
MSGSRGGRAPREWSPAVTAESFHLLFNRHNFGNSGPPARIMFYSNRQWTDFGDPPLEAMRQAFGDRHPAVTVNIGETSYLIDFLRMQQIDLNRGAHRSIAWIDEAGKCFFPKLITGSDEEEVGGGGLIPNIRRPPGGTPRVPTPECFVPTFIRPPVATARARVTGIAHVDHDENDDAGPSSRPTPHAALPAVHLEDNNSSSTEPLDVADAAAAGDLQLGAATPKTTPLSANAATPNTPPPSGGAARQEDAATASTDARRKGKAAIVVVKMDKDEEKERLSLSLSSSAANRHHHHHHHHKRRRVLEEESGSSDSLPDEPGGPVQQCTSNINNKRMCPQIEAAGPGPSSNSSSCPRRGCPTRIPSPPPPTGPPPGFEHLDQTVRTIEVCKESGAYKAVAKMFNKGMKKVDPNAQIVSVCWISHAGPRGAARAKAFHRFSHLTASLRGDPNLRYAWYGTDPIALQRIIFHGFREVDTHGFTNIFGAGVYLYAEPFPHYSAALATPDASDEFRMLLCRVVVGNMERIEQGSRQCRPTSNLFDTGVDDCKDPKCYIIWNTRMNTHILPQYLITFKVYDQLTDTWRRRNLLRSQLLATAAMKSSAPVPMKSSAPVAANQLRNAIQEGFPWLFNQNPEPHPNASVSFVVLLNELKNHLPNSSLELLEGIYAEVKTGSLPRETLIHTLRGLCGDEVLRAVIDSLRDKFL